MNFRQTITVFTLIFLISPSLLAVLTPEQTKDARQIWLNGYDYFEKGDNALKNGQLREARTLLKESLAIFIAIKTKYPGWSSSMIEYRLKLCRSKTEQVEKLLASKNIKLTDDSVDKENLTLKKELKALKEDLNLTKRKLSITLTSLESARRESVRNTNSSTDVEKIIKEKTELEKRYALLLDRTKTMETSTQPMITKKEENKALDMALLKVEGVTKENSTLREKLNKEKDRFLKIANANILLKYKHKVLLGKNDTTKKEVDKLNGKLAEHNEIIARWEKEKEIIKTNNLDLQNEIQANIKSEEKLKTKLDEIRTSDSDDIIIKQLKNENELISKDLDLVHLQLAQELKAKKDLVTSKTIIEQRLARVEKNLIISVQNKGKSISDLEMFKKKMVINDTIIEKQGTTLRTQKKENARLAEELQALTNKYKSIDKKEREFTELAKDSLRIDNKNRSLKLKLSETDKKLKTITVTLKRSEAQMVQMQKDLQDLISQNTKIEKKSLIARDTLKEEIADLTRKNLRYSTELSTNTMKTTMLTEELIAVNTIIEQKDKTINTLTAKNSVLKKLGERPTQATVMEPTIAVQTPKLKTLQANNAQLLNDIKMRDQIIVSLRSAVPVKVDDVKPAAVDAAKLAKMLKSAFHAEESGKKEAASWYYEKVIALDPNNNTALTRLGHIEADNGNYDDAIELLTQGLKNDPNDVEKLQILTICYIRKNQLYKALGTAAKANANAPKDPKTQRYLGIICCNLGWKQPAESLFRESFKLDPTSKETAFNAAVLLASEPKRIKEAKLWYEKAIKLGFERDPGIEKVLRTEQ